jgi:endonuclease/exonuclease/phosphatase family metal-dependent hydrolase
MKLFLNIIIVFLSVAMQSQSYKVMTYNIRLDLASDGENAWSFRKEKVGNLILYYEPDIFGIQEGLPNQVYYLDTLLQNYKVIGQGRDGGQNGEQSSLFYDSNRFEVVNSGTFWLSETPEKISKGWDAQLNRICTYALFKNKKTNDYFGFLTPI